jgi:hypothetical protein
MRIQQLWYDIYIRAGEPEGEPPECEVAEETEWDAPLDDLPF